MEPPEVADIRVVQTATSGHPRPERRPPHGQTQRRLRRRERNPTATAAVAHPALQPPCPAVRARPRRSRGLQLLRHRSDGRRCEVAFHSGARGAAERAAREHASRLLPCRRGARQHGAQLLALLLRQQPPPPPPLSPLLTRALLSRFNLLRHLPVPVGMRPCCPSATLLLLLLLLLSLLLSL